jgi:DNA replication protein DnaC
MALFPGILAPAGLTLGNFDFSFQPSIERKQVETLATGIFICEHCTLLVQGPPGVGKTCDAGSPSTWSTWCRELFQRDS